MTEAPVFVNHGHPMSNMERLSNKTNQQVSCCQTPIQEFGRRMKGRFFVKGNKDERISKKCCDGEENVDCCERNWCWLKPTHDQRGGAYQFFKCFLSLFHLWWNLLSNNSAFVSSVLATRNISSKQDTPNYDNWNLSYRLPPSRLII